MSRRWLITGVSSGLGRALAEAALARGDSVAGTLRHGADAFAAIRPGRAHAITVDLLHLAAIPAAVDAAAARLGGIDILVNNAGYCLAGAIEEIENTEAQALFDVNVFAPLATIRAALPHLRATRAGRIINISSLAAIEAYPGLGLYCASKAALSALSDALAREVEPLGVHVTAVEAGGMRTDFAGRSLHKAGRRLSAYARMRGDVEARFGASDGNQINTPAAMAETILKLSELAEPPGRLLIGQRALDRAEATLKARRALYRAHAGPDLCAKPGD